MIKHTLEISSRPALIKLRNKQLVIVSGEKGSEEAREASFACEDVGVLILQHPAISLSSALLNALLENGCVVVICNDRHLPSGILLPTVTHSELVPRMKIQLEASQPAMKRTWQAIVKSKILAQLHNLKTVEGHEDRKARLKKLADTVKSGDPENYEAQAAKLYWSAYFPEIYDAGDKRNPAGESLFNSCLNYGYAIVRAAVARAIVGSGLQPALGVFHHGRGNAYCLADDLMEPLRPLVDQVVKEFILTNADLMSATELTRAHRQPLLELLAVPVRFGDFTGPLLVTLSRYTSHFLRYLNKETDQWIAPEVISKEEVDAN